MTKVYESSSSGISVVVGSTVGDLNHYSCFNVNTLEQTNANQKLNCRTWLMNNRFATIKENASVTQAIDSVRTIMNDILYHRAWVVETNTAFSLQLPNKKSYGWTEFKENKTRRLVRDDATPTTWRGGTCWRSNARAPPCVTTSTALATAHRSAST